MDATSSVCGAFLNNAGLIGNQAATLQPIGMQSTQLHQIVALNHWVIPTDESPICPKPRMYTIIPAVVTNRKTRSRAPDKRLFFITEKSPSDHVKNIKIQLFNEKQWGR